MERLLGSRAPLAQADLFSYWQALPGEWVEAPNERRGGLSGVQRLRRNDGALVYRKQQVNHRYRDWRHPFGEPTVLREARALQAFAALGVTVPKLLYCGQRQGPSGEEALLVTLALKGFDSLESLYASGAPAQWSASQRARLFQRLGALLARLHLARWQHGCLYPKHVFVRFADNGEPELALLDLEKSRQRLTRRQAARHDLRQLRRHSRWSATEWAHLEAGYRDVTGLVFEG